MKLLLPTSVLATSILAVYGYDDYTCVIPNGGNVFVDGQKVRALGHESVLSPIVSLSRANPFGRDYELAVREAGGDYEAAWFAVCDLDSDNDGRTNGEELCDPDCVNVNTVPKCPNGTVPTNPGGIMPLNDDLAALKIHAWLMMAAWCICAPYGILRAAFFKKGSKVEWYKDHVIAMNLCVLLNVLGMIAVVAKYNFDPLVDAFEYSSEFSAHCIIGIIVFILTLIQAGSGYLRPAKDSENRTKWEYFHVYMGRITFILAIVAIYIGIPILYYIEGQPLADTILSLGIILGVFSIVFVLFLRDRTLPPAAFQPTSSEEERKNSAGESKQDNSQRLTRQNSKNQSQRPAKQEAALV